MRGSIRPQGVGVGCLVVKLVLSTLFTALGICLYINTALGSDAIDVLFDGLSRTLGITIGQADMLFGLASLVGILIVDRHMVGVPSLISVVGVSLTIDVVNMAVAPLDLAQQALAVRLAALGAGQLCLGAAYGMLQTIEGGANWFDAIVLRISELLPGSYTLWRWAFDIALLAAGVFLGGVVGIGTVFYVLVNGASITFFANLTRSIERRVARMGAGAGSVRGASEKGQALS